MQALPGMPDPTKAPKKCSIEGCEGKHLARGWCLKHYTRWVRYGDPLEVRTPPRRKCTVEGCVKWVKAHGYCNAHYKRLLKWGDPLGSRPVTPCLVDGCERSSEKRGWCNKHYKRWRRWGTPTGRFQRKPAEERFWAKVNKMGALPTQSIAPGPCWEWAGSISAWGYGMFSPDYGIYSAAHRYSYELLVGPIPDGLQVDHLCRNRKCVNPSHLEPVTQQENIRRGFSVATFNRLKTHCPQGHPYSVENTYVGREGGRYCRTCARDRTRNVRKKRN